jgi:hypothetical protein
VLDATWRFIPSGLSGCKLYPPPTRKIIVTLLLLSPHSLCHRPRPLYHPWSIPPRLRHHLQHNLSPSVRSTLPPLNLLLGLRLSSYGPNDECRDPGPGN